MKNKKVTIAIPYYNSSPFLLRKCIDSCLKQTYRNIEVIVMTDGSRFDIEQLINDYGNKDKRVIFNLSNENRGVSYRRNLAIDIASGEYIQFVDADDYIEPDMVEIMINGIIQHNSDLSLCAVANNRYSVYEGLFDMKVFCSLPSVFNYLQYTNFVTNKMFKLSVIRDDGLRFDESVKLGEDALFCVEYMKRINYVMCIDKPLYHYIPNAQSATVRYDSRYIKYEDLVIGSITELFKSYPLCRQEQCLLESWNTEKVLGCLGYYRDRKRKRTISTKEFRTQVKKIRNLDAYKKMPFIKRARVRLVAAPMISLIA